MNNHARFFELLESFESLWLITRYVQVINFIVLTFGLKNFD